MTTASLLPSPLLQFSDQDGKPYAGGTLSFYIPNSLSPKDTWQDVDKTILNTNPIVLDSAGRALPLFGDGDYRVILKDVDGNSIFDQLTESSLLTSVISTVMLPVVGATSLQAARDAMGVTAVINTAVSNVSLITGPTGPASTVAGPTGPAGASITGPTGPQGPAATAGGNGIVQVGSGTTDGSGYLTISFPTVFPNLPVQITVSISAVSVSTLVIGGPIVSYLGSMSLVSFTSSSVVVRMFDGIPVPVAGQLAIWYAIGF